jgi:hypothetical protein
MIVMRIGGDDDDDAQVEDWTSNLDGGGGGVPSPLRPYRLGAVLLSGWN